MDVLVECSSGVLETQTTSQTVETNPSWGPITNRDVLHHLLGLLYHCHHNLEMVYDIQEKLPVFLSTRHFTSTNMMIDTVFQMPTLQNHHWIASGWIRHPVVPNIYRFLWIQNNPPFSGFFRIAITSDTNFDETIHEKDEQTMWKEKFTELKKIWGKL